MNHIVVEKIQSVNAGNLKGFATVVVNHTFRISDLRIVRQDNQRPWVGMPSKSYEAGGVKRWTALIEILDQELKDQISAAVLQEFTKQTTTLKTQTTAGW